MQLIFHQELFRLCSCLRQKGDITVLVNAITSVALWRKKVLELTLLCIVYPAAQRKSNVLQFRFCKAMTQLMVTYYTYFKHHIKLNDIAIQLVCLQVRIPKHVRWLVCLFGGYLFVFCFVVGGGVLFHLFFFFVWVWFCFVFFFWFCSIFLNCQLQLHIFKVALNLTVITESIYLKLHKPY